MSKNSFYFSFFFILSLINSTHLNATHSAAAPVVIYMPTLLVLMRAQPAQPVPAQSMYQNPSDEFVINLNYSTNDRIYPSRIERIHNFINILKHSCCPWWSKEKLD